MRKFTGLRVSPATYRIGITQAIAVLPSSRGRAQENCANNDRSTSILIFSYVGLAPLANTPGSRTTLYIKAGFIDATTSPFIVINTLLKSLGASIKMVPVTRLSRESVSLCYITKLLLTKTLPMREYNTIQSIT